MSGEQAERRAEERGEMKAMLKNLSATVSEGFERGEKRFDSIEKKIEDLEITEISALHKKRKKIKEMIISTLIKKGLPAFAGAGALSGFLVYLNGLF